MKENKQKSLYERLGGKDGVAKIVDDVMDNHMKNPAINTRFLGLKDDPEKLEMARKHTQQFFTAGSGGPQVYEGKDMPTAHRGMNISEGEFMHGIDDILAGLDANNVDAESRAEVLAIVYSLKDQIVRL